MADRLPYKPSTVNLLVHNQYNCYLNTDESAAVQEYNEEQWETLKKEVRIGTVIGQSILFILSIFNRHLWVTWFGEWTSWCLHSWIYHEFVSWEAKEVQFPIGDLGCIFSQLFSFDSLRPWKRSIWSWSPLLVKVLSILPICAFCPSSISQLFFLDWIETILLKTVILVLSSPLCDLL